MLTEEKRELGSLKCNTLRNTLVPSFEQTRQNAHNSLQKSHSDSEAEIPRKAEGDTVPLLLETMTLIPVSTKGTEKSTISERSSLMVREPMAMSARL